jgi:predicted transcriptional regulator
MVLVPEAYRNHPDLQKDYPEVCLAPATNGQRLLELHAGMTRMHDSVVSA